MVVVLVSPTDTLVSRWLTGGCDDGSGRLHGGHGILLRIATLTRAALLRVSVLVRYHTSYPTFPPLVAPDDAPLSQPDYTIWAYIRSAAVLEHLRVALGEETFATALRNYALACKMASCDGRFRQALETAAADLSAVFASLVYKHFPKLVVFQPAALPKATRCASRSRTTAWKRCSSCCSCSKTAVPAARRARSQRDQLRSAGVRLRAARPIRHDALIGAALPGGSRFRRWWTA
jgi:hypothetical protein